MLLKDSSEEYLVDFDGLKPNWNLCSKLIALAILTTLKRLLLLKSS